MEIEFPNGFAGNSGGSGIFLSGLTSDGTYLYSGGQHDDESIQDGSAFLRAGAIPFLQKQRLTGKNEWVKFYNSAHCSYLMNILALTSEEKLFAHFDQGVIALLDSQSGAVLKVRQIPSQFNSWKVSD